MRLSRSTRLFSPWRPIRKGTGSIATRLRFPEGLVTANAGAQPVAADGRPVTSDDPSGGTISGFGPSSAPGVLRSASGVRRLRHRHLAQFLRAQDLAMRAVPAHLRPRQDDLKPEMTLDLFAHLLQQIAEELFDLATTQANHVGMFLFQPGLVVVLVAVVMHQVQLIHQAACLEEL